MRRPRRLGCCLDSGMNTQPEPHVSRQTTGAQPGGSWDATWDARLGEAPPDLDRPDIENAIDAAKLAFLGTELPATGAAVEIGCGSARLLTRIALGRSLSLTGVDTSASALQLAIKTGARFGVAIRAIPADARKLPFDSGTFDVVLSGGLLEHFEDPQPVLSEMVRILKPGGLFYADVVPRKLSLYRLKESPRLIRTPWMLPGVYESSFGPRFYAGALERLGCREIRVRSAGVYPRRGAQRWEPRTRWCDGTWLASLFGWYFMIKARAGTGIQPSAPQP